MRKKRLLLLLLILTVCFFSACGVLTPRFETMLQPPSPTGERDSIIIALESYIGNDYSLKYPRSGDLQSAISLEDLDGDGQEEVIVFCRPGSENGGTHVILMKWEDENWLVCADMTGPGVDIEKVLLADFTEDGNKSLLISWNLYSRNRIATVYSYRNGNFYSSLTNYAFSEMAVYDIDLDGQDELFTVLLNTMEDYAEGKLFKYNNTSGMMQQKQRIELDGNISAYANICAGALDRLGTRAFVLDEYKNANVLQTEILYWDSNGLLQSIDLSAYGSELHAAESAAVASDLGAGFYRQESVFSADSDKDGVLEIPFISYSYRNESDKDSATGEASVKPIQQEDYFVEWREYSVRRGEFLTGQRTVTNPYENFYLVLPRYPNSFQWSDIGVQHDKQDRTTTFYWVETGTVLFEYAVFTEADWLSHGKNTYTQILSDNGKIYAYRLSDQNRLDEMSIRPSALQNMFHLLSESS